MSGPSRRSWRGIAEGRQRSGVGPELRDEGGFLLDPERSVCVLAADPAEAELAAQGLRSVGFLDLAGYVLGGGDEQMEAVAVDDVERLLDEGATVIDVREKDERDDGYIPGTQNIPYRLLPEMVDGLPPTGR